MSSYSKKQDPESLSHPFAGSPGVPDDSDEFKYEELSVEDDWSLAEEEEDLEATVKAIQDRAKAGAARGASAVSNRDHLEAVDDFLRNYLLQMGMMETLDCFQTEWYEMVQKGLVKAEKVGVVPDVYTENQHLENQLTTMQLEMEEYKLAVSKSSDTLLRVQRARDHHKMQHMRVVQEKNKLIQDMKKLKAQCDSYERALKGMNEKYQAAVRQTALLNLEREKAEHLNATQDAGHKQDCGSMNQREKTPKGPNKSPSNSKTLQTFRLGSNQKN
ncbi:hypothetical protein LDENG_00253570 [Lucifuga dentata]|nr:hypothetical protein LDENG_00253570 [Lucifuga dentata]